MYFHALNTNIALFFPKIQLFKANCLNNYLKIIFPNKFLFLNVLIDFSAIVIVSKFGYHSYFLRYILLKVENLENTVLSAPKTS